MSAPQMGWLSDIDREASGPYIWQPCFETGAGHIPSLPLWFTSKEECDAWIAEHLIGADWLGEQVGV